MDHCSSSADSENNLCNQAVEMLIQISREKLTAGKTLDAFSAILQAIKLTRGENAIMEILENAKKKVVLCDELTSDNLDEAFETSIALQLQNTFLRDQGNEDILKDAFEDGSSVVCRQCGGLISVARWSAHKEFWCTESESNSP